MALALVYSRANIGIEAPLVTVEVHLSNGLPGFNIVGLPETAVKESKERVRSAILNSQLEFPQRRITINLAPADLPKAGGRFDLAIAVGVQRLPRTTTTPPTCCSSCLIRCEIADGVTCRTRAAPWKLPWRITAASAASWSWPSCISCSYRSLESLARRRQKGRARSGHGHALDRRTRRVGRALLRR